MLLVIINVISVPLLVERFFLCALFNINQINSILYLLLWCICIIFVLH